MTRYEHIPVPANDPGYVIYLIDHDGAICETGWIAAEDDDDALTFVRALGLSLGCEVWQHNRRVGQVAGIAGLAGVNG